MAQPIKNKRALLRIALRIRLLRIILVVLAAALVGAVITAVFIITEIAKWNDTANTFEGTDTSHTLKVLDRYSIDESRLPAGWVVSPYNPDALSIDNSDNKCFVSVGYTDISKLLDPIDPMAPPEEATITGITNKGYTVERTAGSLAISRPGGDAQLISTDVHLTGMEQEMFQKYAYMREASGNHTGIQVSCNKSEDLPGAEQVLKLVQIR